MIRWSAQTARRRGTHHASGKIATALIATVLLLLAGGTVARAQSDDPALGSTARVAPLVSYSQRGIPAEASAENGVIARDRAHAAARRIAWDRLAGGLGITRAASDAQIEAMVASIVIEEERILAQRYAGRLTVNFNPSRVRAFGEGGTAAGRGDPRVAPDPRGAEAPPLIAPPRAASASITAVARYGSLSEWLEIRRRLSGGGAVAAMQVMAIATDRAVLRLSLRSVPTVAAEELARAGITLAPPAGGPGEGWRLGLAGRG